jgi:hypothetical protein
MPPPVFVCDCFHKNGTNLERDYKRQSKFSFFSKKIFFPEKITKKRWQS